MLPWHRWKALFPPSFHKNLMAQLFRLRHFQNSGGVEHEKAAVVHNWICNRLWFVRHIVLAEESASDASLCSRVLGAVLSAWLPQRSVSFPHGSLSWSDHFFCLVFPVSESISPAHSAPGRGDDSNEDYRVGLQREDGVWFLRGGLHGAGGQAIPAAPVSQRGGAAFPGGSAGRGVPSALNGARRENGFLLLSGKRCFPGCNPKGGSGSVTVRAK